MDFAGSLFAVTPERLVISDFSEALYFDEYNTIYILPGVSADVTSFMKPYNPLVSFYYFFNYRSTMNDGMLRCTSSFFLDCFLCIPTYLFVFRNIYHLQSSHPCGNFGNGILSIFVVRSESGRQLVL